MSSPLCCYSESRCCLRFSRGADGGGGGDGDVGSGDGAPTSGVNSSGDLFFLCFLMDWSWGCDTEVTIADILQPSDGSEVRGGWKRKADFDGGALFHRVAIMAQIWDLMWPRPGAHVVSRHTDVASCCFLMLRNSVCRFHSACSSRSSSWYDVVHWWNQTPFRLP